MIRNRFTENTFLVPQSRTGDWYGSSNRTSSGEPMFEAVPVYADRNPKIDMFGPEVGDYLGSTNMFATVRDCLHYFSTRKIKGKPVARAFREARK